MTTPDEIALKINGIMMPRDCNSAEELVSMLYAWQREIIQQAGKDVQKSLEDKARLELRD